MIKNRLDITDQERAEFDAAEAAITARIEAAWQRVEAAQAAEEATRRAFGTARGYTNASFRKHANPAAARQQYVKTAETAWETAKATVDAAKAEYDSTVRSA